ncbi:13444_t:CDS:10 [Acaulospora colombiana]|uniref:13444_t:CDS:1 n=1 Tax=Acaulospora colombiana TaxID=27376 RepID=A0ACA9KUM1_9GLOM|nr:13444_t:CDS:10 [Acaulospora colombiana]
MFADTTLQQIAEEVSDKKELNTDNENVSIDQKKPTILSGRFSLAVKKSWNNEFSEAEGIFEKYKDKIPRWGVAYAEMQMLKYLMSGQIYENEAPEMTTSLTEAEKLANKVAENKEDFETTFTVFKTEILKTSIESDNTSAGEEASLRSNYRWDCELALADVLLFRSILQMIGGNEIKGAFNLRKSWKIYYKVRDEITQIKGNAGRGEIYKHESASSSRWSLGDALMGRRGSVSSLVGFSGSSQDVPSSIEVDLDVEDCLEFGLGLFQFVVSIVPSSFLPMLKTFGFNIDREQSIRMLESCYSRDGVRVGNIQEAINHISMSIINCEKSGVTSTNHRFEKGMTYLISLDFSAAKNIFEQLFYGNTIVFSGKKGSSIRLQGSVHGSTRLFSKNGSTKKGNLFLQFFEFELRPFCGLCLAGCYLIVKSGEGAMKEALDVLKQTKAMTIPETENSSSSIAGSIGLFGTSASGLVGIATGDKKEKFKISRYNKFAGRYSTKNVERNTVSPFILFIILYLRRDIFYMPMELKERWSKVLETTWEKIEKPTDPDTNAVYLLLHGVFGKFLNPDPTIAQISFCECLALEVGIVSETWVIPHCRYELGELFYKKFGNEEAAMEQFKWILKGQRPTSRVGMVPRRDSSISTTSITPGCSIDSNNSDRFKKYEFDKILKARCTEAAEQIRGGSSQQLAASHSRKKSGSTSSLIREVHEQKLQRRLNDQVTSLSSTTEVTSNDGGSDDENNLNKNEQSQTENVIAEEEGDKSSFIARNCKRRLDQLFIYSNIVTKQVLLTVGRTAKTKYLKSQITDDKQRPHEIRRDFWKPIIAISGFSSYTSVMTTNNIIQHKLRTYPKPQDYYRLERKVRMQDDMNQLEKSVYGLCYAINSLVHTKGYEQEGSSKLTIYWERLAMKDLPSKSGLDLKWPVCVQHKKLMLKRGTIMLNEEFKVVQKPEVVREALRKERYLKSRRGRIEAEKNVIKAKEKVATDDMNFSNLIPNLSPKTFATFDSREEESPYIFDIVATSTFCVASGSNNELNSWNYNDSSLTFNGKLAYHTDTVTNLKIHKNQSLISSSKDGRVAIWDLRAPRVEPAQVLQGRVPLLSFDINNSDTVLAAGTELVGEDAKIIFWDLRNPSIISQFVESHSDDITQIQFHPTSPSQFISGSVDGLICIFDLKNFDEDDDLIGVLNSGSSINRAGYFGSGGEYVYCLTHIETFSLWGASEVHQKYVMLLLKLAISKI